MPPALHLGVVLLPLAWSLSLPSTAQERPAEVGSVYTVGGDVTAPHLLSQVDPEPPDLGTAIGTRGECLVALVVDDQGIPRNVHILRGLSPRMDPSILRAVALYRFRPAERGGMPVAVNAEVLVQVNQFRPKRAGLVPR